MVGKKRTERTEPRDLLISEKDREFTAQVYSDYEAAKELKPTDDWEKYDNYVEDDQWDAPATIDEWKARPQVNVCFKMLATIHANMVKGDVGVNVTAKKPIYADYAANVKDMIEYYWDELDMNLKISECEWIRPKLGTIFFKAWWNPSLNDGNGDLDTDLLHPANVFVDPNITNLRKLNSADFIDIVFPKTMKYILNTYSKENDPLCKYTREELKEVLVSESEFNDTEIYGDTVNSVSTERLPASIVGSDKSFRNLNLRSKVNLHEYFYRNEEGKLQVAWVAGQVLLKCSEDDEDMKKEGFYEHGRYPVVGIPYIWRDKRLYGRSALQSLVARDGDKDGMQDIVNQMLQDYLVNSKLVGQGQKAYRFGSIKSPEKWTGEAGQKIPVKGNPHQDVRILQPTQLTNMLNDLEAFMTHIDRVTGMWDVTQGRGTSFTETASGTMALLEQAMKPQDDSIKTLNLGLRELVELWVEMLAEFITTEKEFYKRDKDGKNSKEFSFNPSVILKAPKRSRTSDGGVYEDSKDTERLYFKANVDIGAAVAMTKTYMLDLGINLYEKGALDIEGLFRLLPEFPGKQDTLSRMMELQEQNKKLPPGEQELLPQEQEQVEQGTIDQFLSQLPDEFVQILVEVFDPAQQEIIVQGLMQLPPEALQQIVMLPQEQIVELLGSLINGGGMVA